MKIALVHDWLLRIGGAEKVYKTLSSMFPDADLYTLFYDEKFVKEFLPGREIKSTFLQKIPFIQKSYKFFLPLIPTAAESLDLSEYDMVISSSSSFAKGLVLRPKTVHINYCHTPTRFLWDWHINYIKERGYRRSKRLVNFFQHWLRVWDTQAANRVDYFIANSKHTQQRIGKYYRRKSFVIYPPVEVPEAGPSETSNNFFLIVSQLLPHKNIDIAVDTFNKLDLPLFVAGDGPLRKKLEDMAGKKVKILGRKTDQEIDSLYRQSKAFIMPQEEDFGISAIEAMMRGKPVLALRKGGATEYIMEGLNGEMFDDPIPEVLADGVRRLNENYPKYSPPVIRQTAQKFSKEKFIREISDFVNKHAQ